MISKYKLVQFCANPYVKQDNDIKILEEVEQSKEYKDVLKEINTYNESLEAITYNKNIAEKEIKKVQKNTKSYINKELVKFMETNEVYKDLHDIYVKSTETKEMKRLNKQMNNIKNAYRAELINNDYQVKLYDIEISEILRCSSDETKNEIENELKKLIEKKERLIKDVKHLKEYYMTVKEIETTLTEYKSKTYDIIELKHYILQKNYANSLLYNYYNRHKKNLYKKLRWYSYINTRRHEDLLIEKIKNKYSTIMSKNITIIIGDWSGNTKGIKHISVPRRHIEKVLQRHFRVYHIQEFRTSLIHYETEQELGNRYIKKPIQEADKLKIRKINGYLCKSHQTRTYRKANGEERCINRDINAVFNMRKIVNAIMDTRERPSIYSRTTQS